MSLARQQSIVMCVCVCTSVSVCLSVGEHNKLFPESTCPVFTDFCGCYLWPWLGPPLMAFPCVTFFRFHMDNGIYAHNVPYGCGLIPLQRVTRLCRCAHDNVPVALYRLRCVLRDLTSFREGVPGRSLQRTTALFMAVITQIIRLAVC